jgi:hypothetical protein
MTRADLAILIAVCRPIGVAGSTLGTRAKSASRRHSSATNGTEQSVTILSTSGNCVHGNMRRLKLPVRWHWLIYAEMQPFAWVCRTT